MKPEFSRKENDGVVSQRVVFSDFSLVESIYPSNIKVAAHVHEQANFCMAVEGGCTEVYAARKREYTPFTLEFLPPQQTHSIKASSVGMRAFNINTSPRWLEQLREYSLTAENSVFCRGGMLKSLLLKLYDEFRNTDAASPLVIEGLALEMLAEVARCQIRENGSSPVPRWLKRAEEIIREQFSSNLSLSKIAGEVGVHPVRLARAFRQHHRCSIGEYLRVVRIEYACRKMTIGATPLSEIALTAGFSDQSHFTRIFKRFKGTTPAEYRTKFDV